MVAHVQQLTTFESAVKAAMKEQPGLGLVMEMAPEIQKQELQLWQSLAWNCSKFDSMIKVGIPAAKVDRDIKFFRENSVPNNLEGHSHVILQTHIEIPHELLFYLLAVGWKIQPELQTNFAHSYLANGTC